MAERRMFNRSEPSSQLRATAAVLSVDPSSKTMTSPASGWAKAERTALAIVAEASLAQMITPTESVKRSLKTRSLGRSGGRTDPRPGRPRRLPFNQNIVRFRERRHPGRQAIEHKIAL